MPRITFPKGTKESQSKGLMTPSGSKPFVHIVNEREFYRSFPVWKAKNPRRKHVYEFNGRLLDGDTIMSILKQNMANASMPSTNTSRRRSSPQSSSGSTQTRRMVTRSMTRRASSGTRSSATRSPAQKRQRTRKQSTPRRSYFE